MHTIEAVLQTLMWGSRRINRCANRRSNFMLRVLTFIWEVEYSIRDLFSSAFIFSPTTHCCLKDFKRRRKKLQASGPFLFFLPLFCSHCKFISPCLTFFTPLILLRPHRPNLSTGLQSHYYTVTTVHHCNPQNSGSTDVSVTSQTTTTYPVHHHHHHNNNITNW